jgi:hypothetical protein|tara:strand:- start:1250 stop:1420 length:171 start_codon:yes stop_codon:yes gene_type:complete
MVVEGCALQALKARPTRAIYLKNLVRGGSGSLRVRVRVRFRVRVSVRVEVRVRVRV